MTYLTEQEVEEMRQGYINQRSAPDYITLMANITAASIAWSITCTAITMTALTRLNT
jgi:hypothetical protein